MNLEIPGMRKQSLCVELCTQIKIWNFNLVHMIMR